MILTKTMKIILKWLLITTASLLLLITSCSAFLLLTHTGNLLILNIAEKVEPRFSINLESGSLLNDPIYSEIKWIDKNIQVEINKVNYSFNWSCLLGKICLDQLQVDGTKIDIVTQSNVEKSEEASTELNVELPIDVVLKGISLTNLSLTIDDLKIDLQQFELQANAAKKDIILQPEITGLWVRLPDSKKTSTTKTSQPTNNKQQLEALISQALPEIVLPINLYVTPIKISQFSVQQDDKLLFQLNQLNSKFNFIKSRLTVDAFALSLPESDVNMHGDINFIEQYPINIELKGIVKTIKQLQPTDLLSGQAFELNLSGDLSSLQTDLNLSNKINAQLAVNVDLFSKNLAHKLQLNWQNLVWPLTGDEEYSSKEGRFESSGFIDDYKLKFSAYYQVKDVPTGDFSLIAAGDLSTLNLEQLSLHTLDGMANLQGKLDWSDAIKWQGDLTLNEIDLKQLETQYTGNFSGSIKHNLLVSLKEDNLAWNFAVPQMGINGHFLNYPFILQGAVTGDHQTGYVFQDVKLNNSDNQLLLKGSYAQQKSDLAVTLDFNELSQIIMGAEGTLQANVLLNGPLEKLKIEAQLQADSLSYEEIEIGQLALSTSSILKDIPKVSLTLEAENITAAKQIIDKAKVVIKNIETTKNSEQHKIDLSVNSELVSTDLQLIFTQFSDRWTAALNAGKVFVENQILSLDDPFEIASIDNNLQLTKHCWSVATNKNSDAGKLCLQQADIGETGAIRLTINNYLLTTINPYLPDELQLSGGLSANADLKWKKEQNPIFDLNVHSDDIAVTVDLEGNKNTAVNYPVDVFDIKLNSTKNEEVELSALIYSKGLIDTKIAGQLHPYKAKPQVDASVKINLSDFSPFAVLIADIDKLTGALATDLSVQGDLKHPTVNGHIQLQDVSVNSVKIPVQVKNLYSLITIKNQSASLEGSFYSDELPEQKLKKEKERIIIDGAINLFDRTLTTVGSTIQEGKRLAHIDQMNEKTLPGKATLKGNVDWSNKLFGDLHFSADKLAIYDYEKLDLLVSPDLHLSFAEKIKLNGKIVVDQGKITVKELPEGAISKSKDIIVIDVETDDEVASLPIELDLQVLLGNKLKVDALGLQTTVKGNLLINKPLQKELKMHGELNFVKGSYRALGQQLVLQKSRIIFQGSPSSPHISIEAIRDPKKIEDNVTAGVRVTGTPDQLKLVLFSDPAMAQQETLSYITRGKSLQNNSDSDSSNKMASMLIDIGAGQTSGLMNDIGNKVGISDLSLDTSGSGDEQSVGISGYIAPGVEISYGVGVFDSFTIFAIRYEMFERFYVEASSGLYQAVDAYYEFDWD